MLADFEFDPCNCPSDRKGNSILVFRTLYLIENRQPLTRGGAVPSI